MKFVCTRGIYKSNDLNNLPYSNCQEMALRRDGMHFVLCPKQGKGLSVAHLYPKNWSSVSPPPRAYLDSQMENLPQNLLELRLSFIVTSYIVRDFYHTTTSTATKTTLNKDNSHSFKLHCDFPLLLTLSKCSRCC